MTDHKTPKTAAERQEELIAQLVRLAGSVEGLAQRGTAETATPTGQPEIPPVGVRRVQFSYTLLADLLLGRPPVTPAVPTTLTEDKGVIFLSIGPVQGGATVLLRSRDGTPKTFPFTPDQAFDTGVPTATGIDIVLILAQDGAPLAIAACPTQNIVD